MIKMKKCASAIISISIIASSSMGFAATIGHVTEDASGQKYEYKIDDLRNSFGEYLSTGSSKLYEKFTKETLKALVDSENGYIDIDDVRNAFGSSLNEGTTFDVDQYTESGKAQKISIENVKYVDDKGNVTEGNEQGSDFEVTDII